MNVLPRGANLRRMRTAAPWLLPTVLCVAACGGPKGPIDGRRAMQHVEAMVALGPRPFGSDALGKAEDYIKGQLQTLGFDAKPVPTVDEKEKQTIRNLYVQIDGQDPANGPILVIGAHYDTKLTSGHADGAHNFPFVGAIDGTGGPAVLLELARVLKDPAARPKCNVWLYWIDAEESIDWEWNKDRSLLGSRAFCKWLASTGTLKRVKAFVLLDLIGSKAMKIDRDGNSDAKLLDLFAKAAEKIGAKDRLYEFPTDLELAECRRRGANWGTTDDHQNFTAFGVPSVLLIDFARRIPPHLQPLQEGQQAIVDSRYEQWWHTPDDTTDAMDSDSLALAGDLVIAALPDLDAYVGGHK